MTATLLHELRTAARQDGFTLCGVAPAIESTGFSDLARWVDSGFAGEMSYFSDRQDAYRHPSGVLAGARSMIALAYPYDAASDHDCPSGFGKIARYAWSGDDYHDVIHARLKRLCRIVRDFREDAEVRGVVDTAPLMEREVAQLAGIGWRGKNTLLLNKQLGSYFFLACILTDLELPYDAPHHASHCGTCTACLDACPTGAFPQAGVLDATRCISYLTIEHRGPIEVDLREGIGDWLFGCDICQEVCPWNRKRARCPSSKESFQTMELASLFATNDDGFRERFRNTPLWRTRRRGLLRNAAIVLGNQKRRDCVAVLAGALDDPEPIVRGAVAWALGNIGGDASKQRLISRLDVEQDESVRKELNAALVAIRGCNDS